MPLLSPDQFKNTVGVVRTKSLFYELCYDDSESAVFTLKDEAMVSPSGVTLIPISKIFIEMAVDDPTEISFALHVFGSWDAWEKLCRSDKRLINHIEAWRREAAVRRKQLAFKVIVDEVRTSGKSAFSAAKYLLEEGWVAQDKRTQDGRKKRQEVRETAEEAFERAAIEEDLKRLREEGFLQ